MLAVDILSIVVAWQADMDMGRMTCNDHLDALRSRRRKGNRVDIERARWKYDTILISEATEPHLLCLLGPQTIPSGQ